MNEIMLKILELKSQNKIADAFSIIDNFLSKKLSIKQKSEVIAFRGSLKEDTGDYRGAIEDYTEALSLITKFNYSRYTLELSLGSICENLGAQEAALFWYQRALLTSIKAKNVSGGSAIRGFLMIKVETTLTDEERVLCIKVAKKSWKILQIAGEPNLSNLKNISTILIKEAGKDMIRKPL